MKKILNKLTVMGCIAFLLFIGLQTTTSNASSKSSLEKLVQKQSKIIKQLQTDQKKTNDKVKSIESLNNKLLARIESLEKQSIDLNNKVKSMDSSNKGLNIRVTNLEDEINDNNTKFQGFENRIKNVENRPYSSSPNLNDIYARLQSLEKYVSDSKTTTTSILTRIDKEEYWTGMFKKIHGADEDSLNNIVANISNYIEPEIKESIYFKNQCLNSPNPRPNDPSCTQVYMEFSIGQVLYNITDYISDNELRELTLEIYNKYDPAHTLFKSISYKITSPSGVRNFVVVIE